MSGFGAFLDGFTGGVGAGVGLRKQVDDVKETRARRERMAKHRAATPPAKPAAAAPGVSPTIVQEGQPGFVGPTPTRPRPVQVPPEGAPNFVGPTRSNASAIAARGAKPTMGMSPVPQRRPMIAALGAGRRPMGY